LPAPARHLLRPASVQGALDQHHLSHRDFAAHLGLSASYWSQLFNRRYTLSPRLRRKLKSSPYLQHLDDGQLWDVLSGGEQ